VESRDVVSVTDYLGFLVQFWAYVGLVFALVSVGGMVAQTELLPHRHHHHHANYFSKTTATTDAIAVAEQVRSVVFAIPNQLYSRSDAGKRKPSALIQKKRWKRAIRKMRKRSRQLFHLPKRFSGDGGSGAPPVDTLQRGESSSFVEEAVDNRYRSIESRIHMLELVLHQVVKAPLILDEKKLENLSSNPPNEEAFDTLPADHEDDDMNSQPSLTAGCRSRNRSSYSS